jgi:hypothetical protein
MYQGKMISEAQSKLCIRLNVVRKYSSDRQPSLGGDQTEGVYNL